MSDATAMPQSSGRALALARRKAMSHEGKAGLAAMGQQTQTRQRPAAASRAAPAGGDSGRPSNGDAGRPSTPVGKAARAASSSRASNGSAGVAKGATNGRAVAQARRQALAGNGKGALGMARAGAPSVQKLVAAVAGDDVDCSDLSGREICRLRRQALSQGGKNALQAVSATRQPEQDKRDKKGGCGCGCDGKNMNAAGVCSTEAKGAGEPVAEAAVEAGLDAVCEIADTDDGGNEITPQLSAVRALCMARRQAMASRGKSGMSKGRRAGTGAPRGQGAWKQAAANGLRGRDLAQARRAELCANGRGDAPECRPSGRVRPQAAPVKVEEGQTLRGQRVSGTQVERTSRITGTESGSCRAVTGTEYFGAEQYDTFCGARPAPNPPKVGARETLRGQSLSGTEVGRSTKVTGDEQGSCRTITGTEYMGADEFESFCAGRPAPSAAPAKVGEAATRKGERVSGTTVGRSAKVTGDEPGSCRSLTGTEYLNEAASEVPCVGKPEGGPLKVGVMHTLRGREVSGTAVGRSMKVTGDEPGSCKAVTGTEYIGADEFDSLCATRPRPTPSKVGLSSTTMGLAVSGAAVGRSEKVTGDEPGSCSRLTGSQYYTQTDFGALCDAPGTGGPRKVGVMHTLKGREVSGTQVGGAVKVTGDEYGGCKPITGTEYVGSDHYEACGATPNASPEKVSMSRTWNHQSVSGTAVGRSTKVTGDEYGACKPVTGTAYIGPDQYQDFCESTSVAQSAERVRTARSTPGAAITGSQPGLAKNMTGAERGACQSISGAPYVGEDEYGAHCASDAGGAGAVGADLHPRFQRAGAAQGKASRAAAAQPEPARPVPGGDFSVVSPARAAWERRQGGVTGTAAGASDRVTGPVNLAAGLVSGTPEFRYRDSDAEPVAPTPEQAPAENRITGNGSEGGRAITGDHWARGKHVTGSEGLSARRNMTLRGVARGQGINATDFKGAERPEQPASRVTGSAGNTSAGSLVTLSGGARG